MQVILIQFLWPYSHFLVTLVACKYAEETFDYVQKIPIRRFQIKIIHAVQRMMLPPHVLTENWIWKAGVLWCFAGRVLVLPLPLCALLCPFCLFVFRNESKLLLLLMGLQQSKVNSRPSRGCAPFCLQDTLYILLPRTCCVNFGEASFCVLAFSHSMRAQHNTLQVHSLRVCVYIQYTYI
jgi:hypothetical protein